MFHKIIVIAILLLTITAWGQKNIPKDYFDNPIKIPLILSGNFGELRSNHFHSGLDIKTQQREGVPIYAPADGYINRIKVAHYGYGKALYISHPNGYSTVYAHLQKYAGDIQKFVKNNQYKKESFVIELFPEANQLSVKKGDLIGYTGNSGSSGGPHLHFEIRDASSRPMNPMLFGIEIPDHKKPLLNSVFVYPIGDTSHVNNSRKPIKLRLTLLKDGSYKTENIKAYGKLGFGVSTYDQQDGASNKNGVYTIKTSYNGEEKMNVVFNKFSFAETRYLNQFIDYGYFKQNRSRVQKLFRTPNNPLSILQDDVSGGFVEILDNETSNFNIEVADFKNNKLTIRVPISAKKFEIKKSKKEAARKDDLVLADQANSITKGKYSVYIPANSLYEDQYLKIIEKGDTLSFHKDIVPLHKNVTLTFDASNYSKNDLSKLYIGRLNYKGDPYYNTTYRKGTKLSARVRTMGDYTLTIDATPPTIKAINFQNGKWISKNKTLQIGIEDDLSGISKYRATINGTFILMEYNYKKDVLTYNFDDAVITETENNLKVIVTDNVGNSTTFEATFFRKNN